MRIFKSLDAFAAALGGDIGVSPWIVVDGGNDVTPV